MKIEVIDHERDTRLLQDVGAWERIGRELRLSDPKRYVALLKVAEDICLIHRDPLGATLPSGFTMFATRDLNDFD